MPNEADLFNVQPEDLEPVEDKDWEAELVGPGKRYADNKVAAKSLVEKDRTISARERELAGLREELRQRVTLEEFMDRLSSKKDEPLHQEVAPTPTAVDPEAVADIVEKRVQAARQNERRAQNVATVQKELEAKFGKSYPTKLTEIAQKLGLSQDYIKDMAATAPQALLTLVTQGQAPAQNADVFVAPQTRYDTEKRPPAGHPKMADYEDMRRTKPVEYWSARVQNKIMAEAEKYGRAFYE